MSYGKSPTWLRTLDVIFGLMSVVASIVVLTYRELAISTLILVLFVALLIIGIARTLNGVFAKDLSSLVRAANVGTGILSLILAIIAFLYPQLATLMLIYVLSFALLINGIARMIGGFAMPFQTWLRALFVVVGLFTIVLSFFVFISPALGTLTLVYLLSMSFMLNGVTRIVSGITGKRKKYTLSNNFYETEESFD